MSIFRRPHSSPPAAFCSSGWCEGRYSGPGHTARSSTTRICECPLHAIPSASNGDTQQPPAAVVSTLYSDSYAIGASVLLHSLKTHNTSASHFYLAYLPGRISEEALCVVRAAGWVPVPVPFIPPPHAAKDVHPRFFDQYTKLNIWGLDADTLVRRNLDELFDVPWAFAAVPDAHAHARAFTVGFNAGVLVYAPDADVLARMKAVLEAARYPPEHAEQSFLNVFFAASAVHMPYAYNANLAIKKASPELWRRMAAAHEIWVVHYTLVKPFVDDRDRSGKMLRDKERIRQVMDEAERKEGGLFRDEVAWWREEFERMVAGDVGVGMLNCRRAALLA